MTVEVIGPDHQLPAHLPVRSRLGPLRLVLLLLLVGALGLALVYSVRRRAAAHKAAPAPPSTAVTVATARVGDVGVHLDGIGTVTPVYTASITSQVTGRVVAVQYREGQLVHKGDPLIDVDARPYEASLLQAEGALERDRNLLAEAQMDLARYEEAWKRNAVAKQTLDDQEKVVLQDMGTVKNDEGTLQYDKVQVDYCHIASPIDGRVGLRLVDPGNVVQATGTSVLAVVTQVAPITVVFTFSEDKLAPVREELRHGSTLAVDAFDRTAQKRLASGTLLTLDNQIDTTTGTIKARAVFDNADDALFPNQFVNARLLVKTLRGVTLVPSSAIQQNGPQSFVYVVQAGVARMRTVKVGVSDGGSTQVDGVDPGDTVADSNFDRLHDHAPVTVTAGPPPATPAESGSAVP